MKKHQLNSTNKSNILSISSRYLSGLLALSFCTFVYAESSANTQQTEHFVPPDFFADLSTLDFDKIPVYDELPATIRLKIPRPKLSVHYYSDEPGERYALINHFRAYEGLPIGQDLWVYQIIKKGVVIKYIDQYFLVPK